jgi:hypothetical protein
VDKSADVGNVGGLVDCLEVWKRSAKTYYWTITVSKIESRSGSSFASPNSRSHRWGLAPIFSAEMLRDPRDIGPATSIPDIELASLVDGIKPVIQSE